MKKLILLFLFALFAFQTSNAQFRELRRSQFNPFNFVTTNFGVCGTPDTINFRVSYDHCPNIIGVNCAGGCGNNPYRFTVKLYRNNAVIASQTFQSASDWSNTTFYNVLAYPGDYKATVKLERRSGFLCLGYQTVGTYTTNHIIGGDTGATPNFNIDNNPIPTDGSPINVCISNIKLNAAATSCESKYYIGIQECDRWWNRTYDYEIGVWFQGEAPNNINLQQFASTYSVAPYFTGDPNRQGSILIGGHITKKKERYYRVSVCTGEPSWECKTALIKVNNNCKATVSFTDSNDYILLDNAKELLLEESITIEYEADFVEETEEDLKKIEEIKTINNVKITAFPNPAKDELKISTNNQYNIKAINIYDIKGKLVKVVENINNSLTSINVSNLIEGIYIADVISDSSSKKVKFIVKK